MQILLTEDNFLRGYSLMGTTVGAIDVEDIPQEVQDNCKAYKYIDGEFIFDDSKYLREQWLLELQQELGTIHQWFNDNDYKVNKVVRGNWQADDPRYLEYLTEYDVKYTRKEEIENILDTEV